MSFKKLKFPVEQYKTGRQVSWIREYVSASVYTDEFSRNASASPDVKHDDFVSVVRKQLLHGFLQHLHRPVIGLIPD